jgi:hypothetical protein
MEPVTTNTTGGTRNMKKPIVLLTALTLTLLGGTSYALINSAKAAKNLSTVGTEQVSSGHSQKMTTQAQEQLIDTKSNTQNEKLDNDQETNDDNQLLDNDQETNDDNQQLDNDQETNDDDQQLDNDQETNDDNGNEQK